MANALKQASKVNKNYIWLRNFIQLMQQNCCTLSGLFTFLHKTIYFLF